ncbi:hypothetical protein HispidOSU_000903, partial [Sigmodon hispidus]
TLTSVPDQRDLRQQVPGPLIPWVKSTSDNPTPYLLELPCLRVLQASQVAPLFPE